MHYSRVVSVVLVLSEVGPAIGVNQEKWEAGRAQDYQHNVGTLLRRPSSSYKLLESRIQNSCI